MSISLQKAPGKPIMPTRYRPSRQEGQYIRYRINLAGKKLVQISRQLGLSDSFTRKVVYGFRRSPRIEAEIARILGKDSWNDVVLEARREIQKKPIDVTPKEINIAAVSDDFDRRFKERFEALGEAKQKKLFEKLRRVM